MNHPLNIFVPHCSGLLTDSMPHGDGLVAHGFIKRLAERGHTLHVAAERAELSKPLPPNIKLYLIDTHTAKGAASRLSYMLQVRSLFRRLRKTIRFDLIHQLNPVYTGMSLALWRSGIPVVLGPYVANWPHDPHAMSASNAGLRALLRPLKNVAAYLQQRSAQAILLTTEAARQRVIASDRWNAPLHILPHGLDTDFFSPGQPTRQTQPAAPSKVVLFYANLSERKGIFDLLAAFDLLAHRFPQTQLWIAGGGEDLRAVKARASQLRSFSQIHLLGRQTRSEAVELFREADIYCLPSHGEPFGMTVAEAMSCGLPVVVTDDGGVRWLVDDKGGIRVPVKQPQVLADALSQLLANPDRRRVMGQHNRVKAVSNFSWPKVIDRLEEVYRTTLESQLESRSRRNLLKVSLAEDLPNGGERT